MTLCTNNTLSQNEYTGNGAITEYSITFQYYSQSDIFVAFYDTVAEAWVSVSNSNWSFLNPTVIKFNTAPADNQRILIYRCTDIDPLPAEFFPGNSIKAADLNNNFFVMKSAIEDINTQAGSSDTLAQSAKATADAANTKADTAIATANTADTNATTALNAANSVTATANTALSTANTANTTANTADTAATAAVSSANAAVTTANTADTNATTALNTANTALSTANTANTTANNALSQVSAANPWTESNGLVSLVNSGSSVGIGTNTPSTRLDVVGNAEFSDVTTHGGGIKVTGGNSNSTIQTDNNGLYVRNDGGGSVVPGSPGATCQNLIGTVTTASTNATGIRGKFVFSNNYTTVSQFRAVPGSSYLNSGSADNAVGFTADSTIAHPNATTGIGFFSTLAGTDNYNFYASGSAPNFFAGNVGIGTSSPGAKLEIAGGANTALRIRDSNNGSYSEIAYNDNGSTTSSLVITSDATNSSAGSSDIRFAVDGSEKVRLTSNGNLGLGTSSPTTNLEVVSSLALIKARSTGATSPSRLQLDNIQGPGVAGGQLVGQWDGEPVARVDFKNGNRAERDDGEITFHTAASNNSARERMRLTSGGNLGVGTNNPGQKFVVSEGGAQGLEFNPFTSGRFVLAGYNRSTSQYIQLEYEGNNHLFKTGTSEKMRLTSSGNLGIGTTNPNQKLEISGNALSTTFQGETISAGSTERLRLGYRTGGPESGLTCGQIIQDTFTLHIAGRDTANGDIIFHAGSAAPEVMRLDASNGNLGIGTSTPTRNLVVNRAFSNAFISVKSNDSNVAGILFGDQTADNVGQVSYSNSANSMQFLTNASEKMRITSDGSVGIGTSSPGAYLHVKGTDTGTNVPLLRFQNPSTSNIYLEYANGAAANSDWKFRTGSAESVYWCPGGAFVVDPGGNTGLRVFSNGKIAIGRTTASSNYDLDIQGDTLIRGDLTVLGTINGSSGGGGSVGGTYKNVKTDFGAVGNGTTDDTNAVRTALNSGGTIYFPAGTYRITSTLSHTSAFNVVGDGQQSRIMFDASSNLSNLFNLETNARHNNAKKWSFSSIALTCKAVTNRKHAAGIRIAYTGAATVIGGTNYLELNDVHIVSEITTDATQAYFRYGLRTVNIGGIVADNLNISSFNANAENDTDTQAIRIENSISGHAVIRAFTGNNIYLQRYYRGLYATKAGGGQNIESIYMTQGEIVCNKGIDLAASHATFINGMHIECQRESYINTSDGGPHRVVGCDLRGGRNGTQNLTDYIIKIGVDNCSFTGNYITAQMPSAGCIKTGGGIGNPDNVSIVGNIFNGNGSSTYRALSCESGSANVLFNGNLGSGFGGNSNPVFNQIGTGQGKLNNTTNEFQ